MIRINPRPDETHNDSQGVWFQIERNERPDLNLRLLIKGPIVINQGPYKGMKCSLGVSGVLPGRKIRATLMAER